MEIKDINPGWEPVSDITPTDKFVCTYGGPFAQKLLLNRPAIEKFLSIAALDGRILLEESKRRPRYGTPDINPDGSVTSKGMLRWGEKPIVEDDRDNILFQVRPDDAGWVVAINGGQLTDRLMKKNGNEVRKIESKFANDFNYYLRVGLKEALLKDKLTFTKDHWLLGHLIGMGMYTTTCYLGLTKFDGVVIMLQFAGSFLTNVMWRDSVNEEFIFSKRFKAVSPFWLLFRRTVNSRIEAFAPPLEIDRLALAYGYLDLQMLKGNPLVKIASD